MLPPIYTTLRSNATVLSLVGTRIYRHSHVPQDAVTPYISWSLFSNAPENTLSEVPQIDAQGVQIDCWHTTDSGVETLASAVRDAMETSCHMTGLFGDSRDPETKLYRIGLQFDYWLDR